MSHVIMLENLQAKKFTEATANNGKHFLVFSATDTKNNVFTLKCWEDSECYSNLKKLLRANDTYNFLCELVLRPFDYINIKTRQEETQILTEYKIIRFTWLGAFRQDEQKPEQQSVKPTNRIVETQRVAGFGM